ncbi:MAG TPA: threonine synthase [Desulfurivibrio alkaliphilus]|uniref:Threonine synthase n=1 Tax=Desulfurivibrio alkaliphilus TaxID=427923 RepID=A0A7C2XY39_9BACT|nr:threonine synthase [Desulfurivibrio alkaliphilus]
MRYISTRGGIAPITFTEAVMMGLATDGGLLLPERLPVVDAATIEQWRGLAYPDLACAVLGLFIDDIPAADLERLVKRSYAGFTDPETVPLVRHGRCHILELFHGPTLAFKDVALQLLGNLFEYLLTASGGRMNILGATSGDTGSAAIYGVRGKERINIFILHPHQRVSPIQERQMTTVLDANVFNIAIKGTFDDGQAIVKRLFSDLPFKEKHQLGAINSINWARIVAQVVYYVYATLRLGDEKGAPVDFAVPTGNFGDIFAGFVARRLLGERIGQLILATNENNLLTRFVLAGDYSVSRVRPTSSPSMDIQLASNFERYLYYLNGEDSAATRREMEEFAATGKLSFSGTRLTQIQADFASRSADEAATLATIRDFKARHDYLLDPHTAVGVYAGLACRREGVPLVCLATAHPAKFAAAVEAAIGQPPVLPPALARLADKESRCRVLAADPGVIRDFIESHAI